MAKPKPPSSRYGRGVRPSKHARRGEASGTIEWNPGDIPSVTGGKSPALDFSAALLAGDPRATALADKAMRDQKEEASLADRFLASTWDWTRHFSFNAARTKAVTPILLAYRQAMRHASRFVLDDEFTRLATEVSNRTTPEKLLYRLQFCTLPYATTWIEFDLHVKVRTMRAFHGLEGVPPGVSPRMGLLLERVDQTLSTVTLVASVDGLVVPSFMGYLFSLDERTLPHSRTYNGLTPFDAHYRMKALANVAAFAEIAKDPEAGGIMRRVSRGSMWGFTGKGQEAGIMSDVGDLVRSITVPALLERHGEIGFSRFYDFFELAAPHGMGSKLATAINSEITEFAGMMRWLACVLAMLNEVPTRTSLVQPTHTMRHGLTKRSQGMDYHRVTLRLPKLKPVPFIERTLANVERRHKAHEVREHWRTYVQDAACKREEHDWEYDYPEGYRLCGKCLSFSRLIHEHVRGDASLGWVKKDYVLRPSKQE